ncbi:uncharacterized protein BP5553_03658 [Venustampulla echinocandica]|uniref:Swi5-domain-containing protein n=1 Tax=Venustampulla echinocandica TaxID=2656787 RepID=A0A370TV17_9HELO|nr:uncharacterized protein BP5553_03658 [Venustampulla echinocandica]RDL39318.1 hypothetical protein BP5553_03658 [Venustampulla echinocandica]
MSSPGPSSPPRTAPQSQTPSFIAGTTVENTPIQQCTAETVVSTLPFLTGTTVENTPIRPPTTDNVISDPPVLSGVMLEGEENISDILSTPSLTDEEEGNGLVVELPTLVADSTSHDRDVVERSVEIPESETFDNHEFSSSLFDAAAAGMNVGCGEGFTDDQKIGRNGASIEDATPAEEDVVSQGVDAHEEEEGSGEVIPEVPDSEGTSNELESPIQKPLGPEQVLENEPGEYGTIHSTSSVKVGVIEPAPSSTEGFREEEQSLQVVANTETDHVATDSLGGAVHTVISTAEDQELRTRISNKTTNADGEIEDISSTMAVDDQYVEQETSGLSKYIVASKQLRESTEASAAPIERAHLDTHSLPGSSGENKISTTPAKGLKTKYEKLAPNNTPSQGATEVGFLPQFISPAKGDVIMKDVPHTATDEDLLNPPSSLSINLQNSSTIADIAPSAPRSTSLVSFQDQNITQVPTFSEALSTPAKRTTPLPSSAKQNPVPDSKSSAAADENFSPNKDQLLMAELKAMKIASIQARNVSLKAEIARTRERTQDIAETLTAPASETVKSHIKLLHDYNDIRDVGQGLIGMIADNRGVRVGELYKEFGVGLKD